MYESQYPTSMEVNKKFCMYEGKDLVDLDILYFVGVGSHYMQKPKKPRIEAA